MRALRIRFLPKMMRRFASSATTALPKFAPRFFDRTVAGLKKFGMAAHEHAIDDADVLANARFEAEDLFGDSQTMWKDFETQYDEDGQSPDQLLSFVKSVVSQFPAELNGRIPGLNLNDKLFSAAISQLYGSGVPDEFALDVQDSEKDPRKLAVVFFLNNSNVWKQSHGGHWRFDFPENAPGIIDPVVSPLSGTVLVYWAHKSPFQILSYNVPEEHKLISLHVWLHEYSKSLHS
jgi:hypothetical protein